MKTLFIFGGQYEPIYRIFSTSETLARERLKDILTTEEYKRFCEESTLQEIVDDYEYQQEDRTVNVKVEGKSEYSGYGCLE